MCGHAGMARAPGAPGLEQAKAIFQDALVEMQSRGRHATGLAIDTGASSGPVLWKKAVAASLAVQSEPWQGILDTMTGATRIVIGHTRHATQQNAHIDECAHPFTFGPVTGAHNGMIYNWRELEAKVRDADRDAYDVDSEVVFDLLSKKSIQVALNKLDGYWALVWTDQRTGLLHMVRTSSAPMAVAYVPKMRTIFWASLRSKLVDVLKRNGLERSECEVFELNAGTLYSFDVQDFGDNGTNRKSKTVTFNGIKRKASQRELKMTSGGGSSSRAGWKGHEPAWVGQGRGAGRSAPTMHQRVSKLEGLIEKLVDRIASVDADVEWLVDILGDAGMLPDDSVEAEPLPWDEADEPDEDGDEAPTCYRCTRPAMDGKPLLRIKGVGGAPETHVHGQCVFTGK